VVREGDCLIQVSPNSVVCLFICANCSSLSESRANLSNPVQSEADTKAAVTRAKPLGRLGTD
jgi:hypothetical protein